MSPALWPHGALPLSMSPWSRARMDAGRPTRAAWIGNGSTSASRRSHSRVKLLRMRRHGLPEAARVTVVPSSSMATILFL